VFYFGKSLQAAALAVVGLALFVGLYEEDIRKELLMLCGGVALFLLGKFSEGRA